MSTKRSVWGCLVILRGGKAFRETVMSLPKYINNWYSSYPYCGPRTQLPPASLAPSYLILKTTLQMVIGYAHFIEQKAEAWGDEVICPKLHFRQMRNIGSLTQICPLQSLSSPYYRKITHQALGPKTSSPVSPVCHSGRRHDCHILHSDVILYKSVSSSEDSGHCAPNSLCLTPCRRLINIYWMI